MVSMDGSWCPSCGYSVQPGTQFCASCGQQLAAPVGAAPMQPPTVTMQSPSMGHQPLSAPPMMPMPPQPATAQPPRGPQNGAPTPPPPPPNSRLPWPPPPGGAPALAGQTGRVARRRLRLAASFPPVRRSPSPRPQSPGCPTPWIGCCAPRACSRTRGSSRGPRLPSTAACRPEAPRPRRRLAPTRAAASTLRATPSSPIRRKPWPSRASGTRVAARLPRQASIRRASIRRASSARVSTRPGSTGRDSTQPTSTRPASTDRAGSTVRPGCTGPAGSSARTGRRSLTRSGR